MCEKMAEGKRRRSKRVAQNSRAKRVPDVAETVDGGKEKGVETGREEEKVLCCVSAAKIASLGRWLVVSSVRGGFIFTV